MNYYYSAHKPGKKEKIFDMAINDSKVRNSCRELSSITLVYEFTLNVWR
ncbi:IS1-like element transposase [Pectobacterium polaris]